MNRQNISQAEKHIYDLEERTYSRYIGTNIEDGKQLIKSSGSVGANPDENRD